MASSNEWHPPVFNATSRINNCTVAADWAQSKSSDETIPNEKIYGLMRAMLPLEEAARPTNGSLLDWYERLNDTELLSRSVRLCNLRNPCNLDGNYISLDGDTDVLGIGMIISYYLAMAWASIYFFLLLANLLKEPKTKTYKRFVQSARDTTNTFFDAALVFAVSMLGAGVVRMVSILLAKPDPDGLPTSRAAVNAAYMAVFSVFPPLLLANVARTTAPHHTVRYALWAALSGLAAAIDVLVIVVLWGSGGAGARESGLDDGADTLWAPCRLRRPVVVVFVVAHAVLWVNFLWQLAAMMSAVLPVKYKLIKEEAITGEEPTREPRELLSDWRFVANVGNGILCFVVGWVLLAVYHAHVRVERDFKPNANSWDFGQVLALATWAPVLVDFLTRYLHHPGEAEQRHLKM